MLGPFGHLIALIWVKTVSKAIDLLKISKNLLWSGWDWVRIKKSFPRQ